MAFYQPTHLARVAFWVPHPTHTRLELFSIVPCKLTTFVVSAVVWECNLLKGYLPNVPTQWFHSLPFRFGKSLCPLRPRVAAYLF